MALATRLVGKITLTCKNRPLPSTLTFGLFTMAMALICGAGVCPPANAPGTAASSSPSIWVATRWLRALRNCCVEGRSGLIEKRESPTLAITWLEALHSTTSLADKLSRNRSSASPAVASGASANWVAAWRVLLAKSVASVSSVTRPRFRPASSAPSTCTSNQLSIERETNW